jgi:hypothetical protein
MSPLLDPPRTEKSARTRLDTQTTPGAFRGTDGSNPVPSASESVSRREFVICGQGAALDLSAAGGYKTELPARSIGPTGKVYGQSRPRDPNQAPTSSSVPKGNSRPSLAPVATPAAPPAAPRPSPVALADRDAKLHEAGIPAAPIVALSRPFEDPVPSDLASEQIDLVTLMFNYHDLGTPSTTSPFWSGEAMDYRESKLAALPGRLLRSAAARSEAANKSRRYGFSTSGKPSFTTCRAYWL